MNWIIDTILIFTVLFTVILYTYKGFIKSFFGLFKYGFSFVFAYSLSPYVGNIINSKFLGNKINGYIFSWLSEKMPVAENINTGEFSGEIPEALVRMMNTLNIDIYQMIEQYEGKQITDTLISELSQSISEPISTFISNAIAYILIFTLMIVILSIVAYVLDKVCKLPGLRQVNRAFGFLLGLLCAGINLLAVCAIITIVLSIGEIYNPDLSVEIMNNKTIIYGFINEMDIIQNLIAALKGI